MKIQFGGLDKAVLKVLFWLVVGFLFMFCFAEFAMWVNQYDWKVVVSEKIEGRQYYIRDYLLCDNKNNHYKMSVDSDRNRVDLYTVKSNNFGGIKGWSDDVISSECYTIYNTTIMTCVSGRGQ